MSILSRVQTHPEIGSNNTAYVQDLVSRAKNFIVAFCNLPSFPELAAGYVISGPNASTDISNLSGNAVYCSVNGSGYVQLALELSDCTSGASIATELQRAINESTQEGYGFDEVLVSFDSDNTQYTITSGRYGESSRVSFLLYESEKAVTKALKLAPEYGAVQYIGNIDNLALQDAAVELVEVFYNQLGVEGLTGGAIPGGMSFSFADLDPKLKNILLAHRRL